MKANELRIGNLIYWNIPEKVDTIHTVVGIRNDKLQTVPISLGESIENYQPIQLTEEWLIKFGFPTIGQDREWYGIRLHNTCRREGCYHVVINGSKKVDVKHVHQLQNLYFALTGEELTIKTIDHK